MTTDFEQGRADGAHDEFHSMCVRVASETFVFDITGPVTATLDVSLLAYQIQQNCTHQWWWTLAPDPVNATGFLPPFPVSPKYRKDGSHEYQEGYKVGRIEEDRDFRAMLRARKTQEITVAMVKFTIDLEALADML